MVRDRSRILPYVEPFRWPRIQWQLHAPLVRESKTGGWIEERSTIYGYPLKAVTTGDPQLDREQTFFLELRKAPDTPDDPNEWEWWEPMKERPRLYREAADLDLDDPTAVLAWINRRGHLWHARGNWDDRRRQRPVEDPDRPFYRLANVCEELKALREAVNALDWMRGRNPKGRPDIVEDPIRGVKVGESLRLSLEGTRWAEETATRFRRLTARYDRKVFLVWAAVSDTITWRLVDGLNTSLIVRPAGKRYGLARKRIFTRPKPAFEATIQPASLAACLWYQLFLDGLDGKLLRRCKECGQWFAPERIDQEFCDRNNRNCYFRNYRRRRRREGVSR